MEREYIGPTWMKISPWLTFLLAFPLAKVNDP